MNAAARHFSQTYAEARGKFSEAAEAAGLDVHAQVHPLLGRDGETLALDVVRDGPADARAVLLVSSACHGVEGFCGSGVQVALLGERALRERVHAAGIAVLYLHGLNPHGFSWWRRTTQENVDLNRNFHDFTQPLPRNDAYDDIAHLLVPREWPPSAANQRELEAWGARHGLLALQTAISGGQYRHPEGLFFGGVDPTWSNVTIRHVLRDQGRRCARLGWIDVHSGLGPNGHGERIFTGREDDAAALARARRWWGDDVTSIYDASSSSARLTGLMGLAAAQECPQAECTGLALEFGTVPIFEVIQALRADQWLENHPEQASAAVLGTIKRQVRDVFYCDNDGWKQRVVEQALEVVEQAIEGLSR